MAAPAAAAAARGAATKRGRAVNAYLDAAAADSDPGADPPSVRSDANDDDGQAAKKAPAKKAPAKKAAAKKRPARKRARRSSPVRRARKTAAAPIRRQANQGLRIFGAMVALTLLYLVLTNADTIAPVLGGVGAALQWVRDPVPIPYRNN